MSLDPHKSLGCGCYCSGLDFPWSPINCFLQSLYSWYFIPVLLSVVGIHHEDPFCSPKLGVFWRSSAIHWQSLLEEGNSPALRPPSQGSSVSLGGHDVWIQIMKMRVGCTGCGCGQCWWHCQGGQGGGVGTPWGTVPVVVTVSLGERH